MIPIDRIDVINPRERNSKVFDEIVGNIKAIGLKKPITVTPRAAADGSEKFLLVCGEGRLKAFRSLGEATIPAMVVHVSDEDAFIMSLAENIARRQCRPLELLAGIRQLRDSGYRLSPVGRERQSPHLTNRTNLTPKQKAAPIFRGAAFCLGVRNANCNNARRRSPHLFVNIINFSENLP